MMRLGGSFGSISPWIRPLTISNGPAPPTGWPLFIGSRDRISRRTTSPAAVAAPRTTIAAVRNGTPNRAARLRELRMSRLLRYLHGQEKRAQALAVCVQGQRSRHAPAERAG